VTHTSNFDSTISTYKIINDVLDEIDITSSFNFFTTSATTSSPNLEKIATSKKLYSNDSQYL
jgi:hypothetical protein